MPQLDHGLGFIAPREIICTSQDLFRFETVLALKFHANIRVDTYIPTKLNHTKKGFQISELLEPNLLIEVQP